jgi:hypothetical protein
LDFGAPLILRDAEWRKKIVEMGIISNLCANRRLRMKIMQKDHDVLMARQLWKINHEAGHRENILLA